MSGAQVTTKTDTTIIKNMMMKTSFFFLRLAVCLFMTEFIYLQTVTITVKFNEIVVNKMYRPNKEKMNVLTLFIVDSLTNFRKHQEPG